jgi:hypothetical protein
MIPMLNDQYLSKKGQRNHLFLKSTEDKDNPIISLCGENQRSVARSFCGLSVMGIE